MIWFIRFMTALGKALGWRDELDDPEIHYIPLPPLREPPQASTSPVVATSTVPESEPPLAPKPPTVNPDTLLPWDTTSVRSHANWHNVRVICDQEGLTHEQKEDLCATVWAESEFYTKARLDNKDKRGNVWSVDAGICQWNSYWHGKEISTEEAFNDPEKAVRLMCAYWKRGQQNQWVGHSSGNYKQYLGRTL